MEQKVIDCMVQAVAFDASSTAVLLTNIMQAEDCMGEALRGQGEGKGQLKCILNSDGLVL